jgi:hypothetical protein
MMSLSRLKFVLAVATLVIATAGVAVLGRQQTAPAGQRDGGNAPAPPKAGAGAPAAAADNAANQALARQQLALIDDAWATLHQLAQNARISIADPSFSLWGRRRLETLRRTGATKAEIVAALEKYIEILKMDEVIAQNRVQSARGTQVEIYDVKFRRIEAEIWLNEEKAR